MGTPGPVGFDLTTAEADIRTHVRLGGDSASIRTGADRHEKTIDLESLSDSDLTQNLKSLVAAQFRCTAVILAHLLELERRDLPQLKSYPSLFVYCLRELGFTEDVACRHILAARAIKKFPSIMGLISRGELGLTVIGILNRHLTADNHRSLLGWAAGRSKRDIERRVAEMEGTPAGATRDVIRQVRRSIGLGETALPQIELTQPESLQPEHLQPAISRIERAHGGPAQSDLSHHGPAQPEPGAPFLHSSQPSAPSPTPPAASDERAGAPIPGPRSAAAVARPPIFRLAFTSSQAVMLKLDRAKALLLHKHPAGRLEDIVGELLDFYLKRKDPALKKSPGKLRPAYSIISGNRDPASEENGRVRPGGRRRRRIPQWVKDAVRGRDGGRCAYVSPEGRRCEETGGLEFDHIAPWSRGGESDDPANVRLLCKPHNLFAARQLGLAHGKFL